MKGYLENSSVCKWIIAFSFILFSAFIFAGFYNVFTIICLILLLGLFVIAFINYKKSESGLKEHFDLYFGVLGLMVSVIVLIVIPVISLVLSLVRAAAKVGPSFIEAFLHAYKLIVPYLPAAIMSLFVAVYFIRKYRRSDDVY